MGRELVIVPNVIPGWNEADYVDEYVEYSDDGEEVLVQVPPHQISNVYELADFMKPIEDFRDKSQLCSRMDLTKVFVTSRFLEDQIVDVPQFIGGSLYDFIKLRRDESESFAAWEKYARQVIASSHFTEYELNEAIREGVSEMKERMLLLNSKGLFEAIGMSLFSTSMLVSQLYEGNEGQLSASIAALSSVSLGVKAIVEQSKERKLLRTDPRQFLALANLDLSKQKCSY
ncbi:MAG: hypothetical protein OMM_05027 [Candidatus Magnetoglobus multicellularis str. Araruama]|uniref:Uncharacterized protein n=1 Tax=Candidatus Magnetoglobus multicellularis str. Araruama TaxID=890399 RepID=A0A1V1NYM5_9BACT|nr:MAG: hypothetical protein OMM_05027 [Candidatus Magnetoglobus multicellularis str. Araruama]